MAISYSMGVVGEGAGGISSVGVGQAGRGRRGAPYRSFQHAFTK